MVHRMCFAGVLTLVVSFIFLLEGAKSFSKNEYRELTESVQLALIRVSTYTKENADQLNLDGLTGLSMVKADLNELKAELDSSEWLDLVLENIEESLSSARQQVIAYDAEYYEALGKLTFPDFWTPSRSYLNRGSTIPLWPAIDSLLIEGIKSNRRETMDEDKSDACIEELLHQDACNISKECFTLMTIDDSAGYSATHQVFYTLILGQMGCLKDKPEKIMAEVLRKTCAKIFIDSSNLLLTSGIHRDLFMEQIGLCGLAGYWQEFSRLEWIENVVSWMRPAGCYGDSDEFMKELGSIEEKERFKRQVLSRKKREERIIEDGCLVHRTTVALLALSQHIRALLKLAA